MTIFSNINIPNIKPSANPFVNVLTVASDGFNAQFNAKYLLRFTNGSATPGDIVVNDPNSTGPDQATTFNPDVTVPIAAGGVRTIRMEASRLRDSNGQITWTYSANITHANSTVEIYGPE